MCHFSANGYFNGIGRYPVMIQWDILQRWFQAECHLGFAIRTDNEWRFQDFADIVRNSKWSSVIDKKIVKRDAPYQRTHDTALYCVTCVTCTVLYASRHQSDRTVQVTQTQLPFSLSAF
jgi:hypothetical protein